MFRYGLIGHPVGHSLSPVIHRRLFAITGLSGTYTLLDISPALLAPSFRHLVSDLDGFNITVPHKTAVLPLLDRLDPSALRYGAVNTVKLEDGALVGYNTDGIGFLYALSAAGIPLSGRVAILGCGGAARVFLKEAADAGCELVNVVRPSALPRAESLADGRYPVVTALPSTPVDLLINATPVGMTPDREGCPVNPDDIRATAVFDAVYTPKKTVLLSEAEKRGRIAVGGMSMLVAQAAAAQTIWNGRRFSPAEIVGIVRETEGAE